MKPLRTVVFNDSPTTRALLRAVLEHSERFEVVAEADDGAGAASLVAQVHADLVLMDVVMPTCNGLVATRAIMEQCPVPIVIVSAAVDVHDADLLFEAMRSGALFVAEPPPGGSTSRDQIKQAAFVQTLLNVTAATRPDYGPTLTPSPALAGSRRPEQGTDAIGLCASAGGPGAVTQVLRGLPVDRMPPILLVQHLAAGFTHTFTRWLSGQTTLSVQIAKHDARAQRGHVYLAPEDRHLAWAAGGRLAVSNAPPVGLFRPSASVLLDSLALAGPRAIGIVLTGMGNDGATGAARLREQGGHLVVQSRHSCAVYGMPRAALTAAGADDQLSPDQIQSWLRLRFGGAA